MKDKSHALMKNSDPVVLCDADCDERGQRGYCYFDDYCRCDKYQTMLYADGRIKKYQVDIDGSG